MATPERLPRVQVHGGRWVEPGDRVKILPVELREKGERFDEQSARKNFEFLQAWLGDGPFTISYIGKWPDGSIYLYINGSEVPQRRVNPSDFM